jgi:hypothetical protein
VGLTLFTPAQALVWWPAYGGNEAFVASVSGNQVTIGGLTAVPVAAPGKQLILSNAINAGNDGSFLIQSRVSPTSVVIINNGTPIATDYGISGVPAAPTIAWSMPNPVSPFTSTVAHVDVLVNPTAVAGYVNPDGSLNGKFFAAVNAINPVLDLMLPADCTFDWYILGIGGATGWLLDQPNLDLLTFDS